MMHGTERPVAFQGDLRNLPEALAPLKKMPNWVCWRWEWRPDKKRRLLDQATAAAEEPTATGEEQRPDDLGHL